MLLLSDLPRHNLSVGIEVSVGAGRELRDHLGFLCYNLGRDDVLGSSLGLIFGCSVKKACDGWGLHGLLGFFKIIRLLLEA